MSIVVKSCPLPCGEDKRKKLMQRGHKNKKPAAPLPRCLLEKGCELYDCNCSGPELLLTDNNYSLSLIVLDL